SCELVDQRSFESRGCTGVQVDARRADTARHGGEKHPTAVPGKLFGVQQPRRGGAGGLVDGGIEDGAV
ncbi:MAG: hypothetical protein M3163_08750, partial [Actinomycetota bacterium]|nr:hypothetical protein [Actinomycetota bacterium]